MRVTDNDAVYGIYGALRGNGLGYVTLLRLGAITGTG